jgi:hypothetical protein
MQCRRTRSEGITQQFFTSALDEGEWSASRPGRFTPGETAPGSHRIGGWVSLRAGLDVVEWRKCLTLAGDRIQAVQPAAHRYTDWDIPAPLRYSLQFVKSNPKFQTH